MADSIWEIISYFYNYALCTFVGCDTVVEADKLP